MHQITLTKNNTLDFFLILMEKIKTKGEIKLDISSSDLGLLNKLIGIRNKNNKIELNDDIDNDLIKNTAKILQKKGVFKKLDNLISSKLK